MRFEKLDIFLVHCGTTIWESFLLPGIFGYSMQAIRKVEKANTNAAVLSRVSNLDVRKVSGNAYSSRSIRCKMMDQAPRPM